MLFLPIQLVELVIQFPCSIFKRCDHDKSVYGRHAIKMCKFSIKILPLPKKDDALQNHLLDDREKVCQYPKQQLGGQPEGALRSMIEKGIHDYYGILKECSICFPSGSDEYATIFL